MYEDFLDQRTAPFETAAPRPPQGKDISTWMYLMLRSAPFRDAACGGSSGQGARLEERTTPTRSFTPLVQ